MKNLEWSSKNKLNKSSAPVYLKKKKRGFYYSFSSDSIHFTSLVLRANT